MDRDCLPERHAGRRGSGVPEIFASSFDIRILLQAPYGRNDREPIDQLKLPFIARMIAKVAFAKVKGGPVSMNSWPWRN